MRIKEAQTLSKAPQPKNASPQKSDEEFNFGAGFEKFASNNNPVQGDNINDFDFGSDVIQSKKPKKDEFDFNFGGAGAQKSSQPASSSGGGDLMDLLGGVDMNAQPQ